MNTHGYVWFPLMTGVGFKDIGLNVYVHIIFVLGSLISGLAYADECNAIFLKARKNGILGLPGSRTYWW